MLALLLRSLARIASSSDTLSAAGSNFCSARLRELHPFSGSRLDYKALFCSARLRELHRFVRIKSAIQCALLLRSLARIASTGERRIRRIV